VSDLTASEQANVRVALQFVRVRSGGWAVVANALHFKRKTLMNAVTGGDPVSASMAFRLARFVDVAIEDVLDGTYPPASVCPHCGHRHEHDAEGVPRQDVLKLAR
jgi:hypothetical protein